MSELKSNLKKRLIEIDVEANRAVAQLQRLDAAQAASEKIAADIKVQSRALADLETVTASERVEAVLKVKGTVATSEEAERKAQQKAALKQLVEDLNRDIALLKEDMERTESEHIETGKHIERLWDNAAHALELSLIERLKIQIDSFLKDVIYPLDSISVMRRNNGPASSFLLHLQIGLPDGGYGKSLYPSVERGRMDISHRQVVEEMIKAKAAD